VRKKEALEMLGCNNQELAKMLNITPSYLSRFDELNEFHTSVVYGRFAVVEAKVYRDLAESLEADIKKHLKTIDRVSRALDN
jgi:hypothetical protein